MPNTTYFYPNNFNHSKSLQNSSEQKIMSPLFIPNFNIYPSNSQLDVPNLNYAEVAGLLPIFLEVILSMIIEILQEMHSMEQFFIKIQNVYAFLCQMCFFVICHTVLENNKDVVRNPNDLSVIVALTSILFYSVIAYFAARIRDICVKTRSRSTLAPTPSYSNYLKALARIILEWLKAAVVVICLREQGLKYDPKLAYTCLTFFYYICTEKIFLEILPSIFELFELQMFENLEHLYVPLVLNVASITMGVVFSFYGLFEHFSTFLLFSMYFTLYLRCKDLYYNYWQVLVQEKRAYARFKTATESDILRWDDICAVCLNQMSKARITPCQHLFHPQCLKQCLKSSFNCPLCKQEFLDRSCE